MDPEKVTRRKAIGTLGAAGAALAAACGGETPTSASEVPTTAPTVPGGTSAACAVTPSETIGPYPSLADLIRSDIREGQPGTPVALTITVVDSATGCGAVADAVVDIWQCDAEGHYSQYSQPGYNGTAETFLRGIQATGANGQVTFTTIFPGWYQGRATHIHVEVSVNGRSMKVTQIAFPDSVTAQVYDSGVYAARGQNPTSNASDMIFGDDVASELATVTGNPSSGYVATFTVVI